MTEYYKDLSDVVVTFKDGEVKTYRITASPSINGYLVREARNSGVLSLFNREQSWAIPLENIREWSIEAVEAPPAPSDADFRELEEELDKGLQPKGKKK